MRARWLGMVVEHSNFFCMIVSSPGPGRKTTRNRLTSGLVYGARIKSDNIGYGIRRENNTPFWTLNVVVVFRVQLENITLLNWVEGDN